MFSISGYLKEWLNTTKNILTQPRNFFQEMPTSGSLKEHVSFMAFTTLIASLLSLPIIMLTFADYLPGIDLTRIILLAAGLLNIILAAIPAAIILGS